MPFKPANGVFTFPGDDKLICSTAESSVRNSMIDERPTLPSTAPNSHDSSKANTRSQKANYIQQTLFSKKHVEAEQSDIFGQHIEKLDVETPITISQMPQEHYT